MTDPQNDDLRPSSSDVGSGAGQRFYEVSLISTDGGERIVRVPSKTDVQAGDAAAILAHPGEAIGAIVEVEDDGVQEADGPPAGTQTHPDWTA